MPVAIIKPTPKDLKAIRVAYTQHYCKLLEKLLIKNNIYIDHQHYNQHYIISIIKSEKENTKLP